MKVIVAGDIHFPHQDDKVISLFEQFVKDYKPDIIIFNGDLLDCETISRFDKIPGSGSFIDEINSCKEFLEDIRRISNAEIHYITGNHEFRLRNYLLKNTVEPDIYQIVKDSLSIKDLLELDRLDIKLHDLPENITRFNDNYIILDDIYIGHFNRVSKHSAYTAKGIIDDKGVSVIQGHTHRLGMYYKKTLSKNLVGVETGCLCSINPNYCIDPNWQNGFCIIENKSIYPILIQDYSFTYGGKKYTIDI